MTIAQSLPATSNNETIQPTNNQVVKSVSKIAVAQVPANTIFPNAPTDLKVLTYLML